MRREEAMTMPPWQDAARARLGRRAAGGLIAVVALFASGVGVASEVPQEFRDSFTEPGPLQGTLASHPYEIKSGVWTITDADLVGGNQTTASNRILVQSSKAGTPNEPVVFVRDLSFREVTAEVTMAIMDPMDQFGTLTPGASAGLVIRSPIHEGVADSDNLYLFSAFSAGIAPQYPTGKALGLFKRVARGYELLSTQTVHTWADLTQPHRYKLVMGRGRIRAYFDNRLVIDHTDIPSPDHVIPSDPFPGLPFDQGAVGLRTSATRAWFDDLVIVGNDAYEGRAFVSDAYTQAGDSSQARRGAAITLSQAATNQGVNRADTGFALGAEGIDTSAVSGIANPFDAQSELGGTVRTTSKDGAAISTVRLAGGELSFREPMNRSISATLITKGIETVATASCETTTSRVVFTETSLMVEVADDPVLPDMVLGPFPLATEYAPNTVIREVPGYLRIIAHQQIVTTAPHRVEAVALRIAVPEGTITLDPQNVQVPGVTTARTPRLSAPRPPLDLSIAGVTAGRYCR